MHAYEAPSITKVGTVADLTQGNIFQRGQDSIQWIPIGGPIPGWPPGAAVEADSVPDQHVTSGVDPVHPHVTCRGLPRVLWEHQGA